MKKSNGLENMLEEALLIFNSAKQQHLNGTLVGALVAEEVRDFVQRMKAILLADAADGAPEATKLLAELKAWEERNKPD